jgi:hypothetical protein
MPITPFIAPLAHILLDTPPETRYSSTTASRRPAYAEPTPITENTPYHG